MGVILYLHLYGHPMELSGSPFMFKMFILKMRSAAILVSPSRESKGFLPSFVCPAQFPLILYQMLSYHKSTMHYINVNYFAECHSVAVTAKGSSRTTIRPSRMHVLVHSHQGTPRRLKIIHPSWMPYHNIIGINWCGWWNVQRCLFVHLPTIMLLVISIMQRD